LLDFGNIRKFSLDGFTTIAKVCKVYDGDTITTIFKYKGEYNKWSIRIYGIDTPEIRTSNVEEKAAGIAARDFLQDRILNKIVRLECKEFDKYGRLLANVFFEDQNISETMIEQNMAKPYFGGKKEIFAS